MCCKKCALWLLLFGIGFPLFAQTPPRAFIFFQPISGLGSNLEDRAIITTMLTNEIQARNCVFLDSPHGSDFILYGTLGPYYHGYDELYTRNAPPGTTSYSYNKLQNSTEQLYLFELILRKTNSFETVVQQNLVYASIEDVYNFFPVLMYNLTAHIFGAPVLAGSGADSGTAADTTDDSWRNKWLYFRGSFDFPISYYALQGDGLIGGIGIYKEDEETNLTSVAPIDNRVVALPAVTLGIEIQFFKWLSLEPIFQLSWEYLNDVDYIDMSAGAQLKFPLKFMRHVMLEPYGVVMFPIPISFLSTPEVFDPAPPLFGYGGGIQIGVRGGKPGTVFIDASFMYYGDVGIKNHYGDLYPSPTVINYKKFVLGFSIGYKFGVFNRKR
ncbi:MAG: hypothetical protein LBI06_06845 [Treponema sp.]|jgi:hypothetical protein|nr:hypothetical protein [Treponema sp.]